MPNMPKFKVNCEDCCYDNNNFFTFAQNTERIHPTQPPDFQEFYNKFFL